MNQISTTEEIHRKAEQCIYTTYNNIIFIGLANIRRAKLKYIS